MLKRFGRLFRPKLHKKHSKAVTIQNITIFGWADCEENSPLFHDVMSVTEKLAEVGYTIVDGGGPGVMLAATLGAKKANGKVIGVTLHPKDMTHFEGHDPRNVFDHEIRATNYVERTMYLLKEGQVYVVFKGGTGTISEFGMAWGLARLYFGHHKPLILYGKFWTKIIEVIKENMGIRPEELKVYKIVDSPEEVLQAIKDFEKEIQRGEHNHYLKTTKGDFSL